MKASYFCTVRAYCNIVVVYAITGEVNVNTDRDDTGNSLLITACQNGLQRIAKLLLRKGADINARVLVYYTSNVVEYCTVCILLCACASIVAIHCHVFRHGNCMPMRVHSYILACN